MLGLACFAGFESPLGGGNLLAQAGGLHQKVVHGMAVVAVGFGVGEATLELAAEILGALLQMFQVTALNSILGSARHKKILLEIRSLPPLSHFFEPGRHPVACRTRCKIHGQYVAR
jgi:hypothetical protein